MLTGSYGYESVREQSGHEPMLVLLTPTTKIRIVVIPGLAAEIGDHPSQVLNQLLYLIQYNGRFVDGRYWAYASAREMHEKTLTHLSQGYIDQTLRELEEKGLIDSRKDLNRLAFDRTKWYAVNREGVSRLESVVVGWEAPQTRHAEPVKAPSLDIDGMDSGNDGMDSGEGVPFQSKSGMESNQIAGSESNQKQEPIPKSPKNPIQETESNPTTTKGSNKNGKVDPELLSLLTGWGVWEKRAKKYAQHFEEQELSAAHSLAFDNQKAGDNPPARMCSILDRWLESPIDREREVSRWSEYRASWE
ncbi:MAG: hypothetical protein ACC700_13675 [Anaerolineales bacterium]